MTQGWEGKRVTVPRGARMKTCSYPKNYFSAAEFFYIPILRSLITWRPCQEMFYQNCFSVELSINLLYQLKNNNHNLALAQFCFIAHPGALSLFFHLCRSSTLAVSPAHLISQRVHLGTQVFLISNQPSLKAPPVFSAALPGRSLFKCAKQTLSR